MPLSPGEKLGPYEIVSPLGAGGMGEVYRARDSKLKREVAIKVLPADVANDRERLARFQREAEVLAALNHPHIAHVYGIEGTALVMELVEGEDLSKRIAEGAIPLNEALPIAKQIAEALEAAHEQGIVHRDLKPANIKVRDDGTVKVLDFGLAKGSGLGDRGSGDLANSPTITSPAMTMQGVILGTAAYMSPEQAKGKTVDRRADVWAFGAVLYEMLSGARAFKGDDVTDIITSVMRDTPDWTKLPNDTPAVIRTLLRRCLEKDPRKRAPHISVARLAIDDALTTTGELVGGTPVIAVAPPRRPTILPWAIAAASAIAAVAFVIPAWRTEPATRPFRFVEPVSSELSGPNPVLAPDGTFIVYRTDSLQLRRFADLETHEIPGTKGAVNAFISPDSRWIGFYADGQLKKVTADGREPVTIAEVASDSPGAAFVSNDRILFSPGYYKAVLQSVAADGGPVTPVSKLDDAAGERGHWWPSVLPDGRHVLFTIWYASTGLSASKIGVLDLQSGTHRVLFAGARPQFANGHVLFYRAGQYHVAPFNPSTQEMTGDSKVVLPDAMSLDPTGDNNATVSVAATGMVAYWPGELYPVMQFSWLDRKGQLMPTGIRSEVEGAVLSPDDRQVVVGRPQAGLSKIWLFDLAGGERQLDGDGASWGPTWHPDGRRIIYTTIRKGEYDVATRAIDGPEEVVLSSDRDEGAVGWLGDGRLLIKEWSGDGTSSILMHDPGGKPRITMVGGDADISEAGEAKPSPDGKWLAFCGNPSGSGALYVRAMTAGAPLQRVTAANSYCTARWSPNSKELAFVRGNNIVTLTYDERDGRLVPLQETIVASLRRGVELYGISRDGSRFLVGVPPDEKVPVTGIRIISDGIAALSRGNPQ
jgi:predicted Ser/Thr protein kinase